MLAHTPLVYLLVGPLALAAVYLLIRLLVWDRYNQETPNQEDPLLRAPEDP
jgi:hypothetical protein